MSKSPSQSVVSDTGSLSEKGRTGRTRSESNGPLEAVDRKEHLDGDAVEIDDAEKRRLFRKIDLHILPMVSLLYLLSFLDRGNIGNAKVANMGKTIDLSGLHYNIAAAVFFITYACADIPSNVILKICRPSLWIPSIMVAWGLIMTLMCLVKTYHSLIICRAFLGLAEGGLFPGVTYYISLWYPRQAQATRVAIFFSAATIAGAFGGILAYGIEKMEGVGGLHGWQWIFCLEGILTVLVAFSSYFLMYDYPETASFLTEAERTHLVGMLAADATHLSTRFDTKFIWQALCDYKSWIQFGTFLGLLIPIYSLSLFMPIIINELGYKAAAAQLLTVPPYVLGCVCTIGVGLLSDRTRRRGPFVLGGALVGLVGFIILYNTTKPGVGYFGAFLTAVGVFPPIAAELPWAGNNAGGTLKRGVVIAIVIGVGNFGGICSSFIYFDPPRYHVGHAVNMGVTSMTIVLSAVAMWNYRRLNREKDALCAREGILPTPENLRAFSEMGDDSPLFRYVI